jgi:hypothetical protein
MILLVIFMGFIILVLASTTPRRAYRRYDPFYQKVSKKELELERIREYRRERTMQSLLASLIVVGLLWAFLMFSGDDQQQPPTDTTTAQRTYRAIAH